MSLVIDDKYSLNYAETAFTNTSVTNQQCFYNTEQYTKACQVQENWYVKQKDVEKIYVDIQVGENKIFAF